MATDKLVARVDWRPLADDQLGLHELVVWGCPTIGPEAAAPLCRLLTDRNGWAGPVANFQLFAALVVMWKSVEQLNQATPGAFFSIPFPSITAIGTPNQQTGTANRRAVDDARAVARQLTRDLFNERRRVSGAAVPTLVFPGSEETEGDLLDAAFGELDIFSAAGIVGMMARGTWQKERDRFYLYRRGTLFDAKALLQWGETNRARVGAGQEPLPLPSELEPYKQREAAKPIAWAAAGAGVAAAVIAGGYYGLKSRGRRSNPATRRPKPRGLAPLVSRPSRRRPPAKKTNPRRKAAAKAKGVPVSRLGDRTNPRAKGWIGKVDREMTADDTEGDFTAQARRAGYANTLTYARAVMRGWRSGKKTVLNKKKRRQQGVTLRTMRRANFALNAQKRKRNPAPKKKNPRKATPRLTAAQARALSDYIRWAGPKWQTKLRGDWMRAGSEWPGEWAHLQQLRNKLGTTTAAAEALVDANLCFLGSNTLEPEGALVVKRPPKKKNPRKAKRETKAAWIKRMTGPRRGKKSLTRKQAEGLWKGAHTKKRAAA